MKGILTLNYGNGFDFMDYCFLFRIFLLSFFPCRWSQREGVQRMLMERDHIVFLERWIRGVKAEYKSWMNEDGFLGKMQRRIIIF